MRVKKLILFHEKHLYVKPTSKQKRDIELRQDAQWQKIVDNHWEWLPTEIRNYVFDFRDGQALIEDQRPCRAQFDKVMVELKSFNYCHTCCPYSHDGFPNPFFNIWTVAVDEHRALNIQDTRLAIHNARSRNFYSKDVFHVTALQCHHYPPRYFKRFYSGVYPVLMYSKECCELYE